MSFFSTILIAFINKCKFLAPPQSPHLSLTATTTDSLTLKLKPHETDAAPIHGYTLHYKQEFGDWETTEVALDAQKYTINSLYCGSRYQVYATGYNRYILLFWELDFLFYCCFFLALELVKHQTYLIHVLKDQNQ